MGLAIACVVAAGCSDDVDSAASTTSIDITTTTASTTSTTTAEEAVLDAYRAFWAAYLRAADPMDPQHPDLVATATGEQLEQVQRAFLARLAGGEVIRGTIETHPQLEGAVQDTVATVVDCATDDSHIFDAATGAQKDSPGTVTHQLRADMVLVDGTWKVSAINLVSDGCTPP